MKSILFLLPLVMLWNKSRASASYVDSATSFSVGYGWSSYEIAHQSIGNTGFNVALSWNDASWANYLRVAQGSEIEFNLFDETNSPTDDESKVFLGHQFRIGKGIFYVPLSVGASLSFGDYRGKDLGFTPSSSDDGGILDLFPAGTENYQPESFVAPGVFCEVAPTLLFWKTVSFGLDAFADANLHEVEAGVGLQLGIVLNP